MMSFRSDTGQNSKCNKLNNIYHSSRLWEQKHVWAPQTCMTLSCNPTRHQVLLTQLSSSLYPNVCDIWI